MDSQGGALKSPLSQVASKGAAVMFAGQVLRTLLQVGGVAIYARLLAPSDFGFVAMVTGIIGIGVLFREFGLSQSAVQAKVLPPEVKSNLFWLNLLLGAIVSAIVALSAPLIARFYGNEGLTPLVWALSPVFVLGGATTQFRAQMARDLNFHRSVQAEVVAQFCGLSAGVVVAVLGGRYWALATQQVFEALVLLLASYILAAWRPGRYSRQASVRDHLRYGSNVMGTQSLVYASQNVDSVMIGRNFGPGVLGGYNRAFQLLMLPINQISAPATKVALPVLSRLIDEPARYNRYLIQAQTLVALAVTTLLGMIAISADGVVNIVLGPDWDGAVIYFRLLAIAGCFQSLGNAAFWVFLSQARTRENLKFTLTARTLLIGAIALGSFHSVEAVAVCYSGGLAATWLAGLWWIRRWAPVKSMLLAGCRVILIGVLGFGLGSAVMSRVGDVGDVVEVLLAGASMLASIVLSAIVIPGVRNDLTSALRVLGLVVPSIVGGRRTQ